MTMYSTNTYHNVMDKVPTLWTDYQGLTLTAHQTTTVYCHTTYCNVILIVCLKTSQFILCNTDISDVQKSIIWGLGTISGNGDEVESALSPPLSVQFTVIFTAPSLSSVRSIHVRLGTDGGPEN